MKKRKKNLSPHGVNVLLIKEFSDNREEEELYSMLRLQSAYTNASVVPLYSSCHIGN